MPKNKELTKYGIKLSTQSISYIGDLSLSNKVFDPRAIQKAQEQYWHPPFKAFLPQEQTKNHYIITTRAGNFGLRATQMLLPGTFIPASAVSIQPQITKHGVQSNNNKSDVEYAIGDFIAPLPTRKDLEKSYTHPCNLNNLATANLERVVIDIHYDTDDDGGVNIFKSKFARIHGFVSTTLIYPHAELGYRPNNLYEAILVTKGGEVIPRWRYAIKPEIVAHAKIVDTIDYADSLTEEPREITIDCFKQKVKKIQRKDIKWTDSVIQFGDPLMPCHLMLSENLNPLLPDFSNINVEVQKMDITDLSIDLNSIGFKGTLPIVATQNRNNAKKRGYFDNLSQFSVIKHISGEDFGIFAKKDINHSAVFIFSGIRELWWSMYSYHYNKPENTYEEQTSINEYGVCVSGSYRARYCYIKYGDNIILKTLPLLKVPAEMTNPETYRGITTFINHACAESKVKKSSPDFYKQNRDKLAFANIKFHNSKIKGKPIMLLYTLRDIKKGEQLLLDYNGKDTSDFKFFNKSGAFFKDTLSNHSKATLETDAKQEKGVGSNMQPPKP